MQGLIANIILVLILLVAVGGAIRYIYKEKKNGRQCIGCPSNGNCSCGCQNKK